MLEKILNNKKLFIVIHIIIGFLGTLSVFPKFFGIIIVIIPIIIISNTKNIKEEAFLFSSYIVGAEVFLRMTKGLYLYETSKYSVILFLLIGIFIGEFKQRFSLQYLFYILLLLLGIIFTNLPQGESLRNAISFNLSGPIVLGIAAIYFYKRPITKQKLIDSLFFMLLPLFSMITYLYFRTPDINEIVFGGNANFEASGGFGPNQVSTAVGIGIFILGVFILTKQKLTGYLFLDSVFLIYFIYRCLLTFSRGGLITAVIILISFSFFYFIYKKVSFNLFFKYFLIVSFFSLAIWLYTSNITGGMINNRYTGKNAIGVQQDISTGREKLFIVQFDSFLDNPLGIGVGNGKYKRQYSDERVTAASHNEVGRLLEEHGYLGFFILMLLLIVPLFNFFNSSNYQRAFIISFYIFWFLTINHSAMRIALPGFIYALSLIIITDMDE